MVRAPDRWKALIVAGILLVSAGAGIAWVGDDAPAEGETAATTTEDENAPDDGEDIEAETSAPADDGAQLSPQDFDDGQVLESFSDSFAQAPGTGTLDLRIDHGPVRVVGWDEPAYEVLVLQENASDDPAVHDRETTVDFQDDSSGDALDLRLVVDRDGTYGVGLESDGASTEDPHRKRGIVAFVPSGTSYDEVLACSGQEHPFENAWEEAWPPAPGPWSHDRDVDADDGCVSDDESPDVHLKLDLRPDDKEDKDKEPPFGLRTGATGIDGDTLRVASGYGDVDLRDIQAETLTVLTGHGHQEVRDVDADNTTLLAGYGDVVAPKLSGGDLHVFADHGDIAAGFAPQAAGTVGTVSLTADYGDVALELTPPGSVAYDVAAGTDYGNITVDVRDTSVDHSEENESWKDPDHWTSWWTGDDGYEHTADGRTDGWDQADLQTEVRAFTDHGDVLVTDGIDKEVPFEDPRDKDKDD